MSGDLQGSWYAKRGGKVREFYTILHLPYTSMVLSYVLIGAALSSSIYPDRVILTLLAYFLGLGLSAHALNELNARHWGDTVTRRELMIAFLLPLTVALGIGVYGILVLYSSSRGDLLQPSMLLTLIVLETFFLFAYNLDYLGGRFHNDLMFAFSWAFLPFITSYFVNSLSITLSSILVGLGLAATAMIEINLSRWCKDFRRRSSLAEMKFEDGTTVSLSTYSLIRNPERALKLIVIAVDLLGIGLMLGRIFD